ncbi:MAG: hypothetical protein ABIR55_00520 [Burkholderiaceae bacterium]
MAKIAAPKKPILSTAAVRASAKGAAGAQTLSGKSGAASRAENAPVGQKSGLLPDGDARLTANIRADLHLALKIRAAQERTTIGELIEQWVAGWKS